MSLYVKRKKTFCVLCVYMYCMEYYSILLTTKNYFSEQTIYHSFAQKTVAFSVLQCSEDAERPVRPAVHLPAHRAIRLNGASSGNSVGR